jgi:hypothetical protein
LNCKRGIETVPTHVRHHIHHAKHPTYTPAQLKYSVELLKMVRKKLTLKWTGGVPASAALKSTGPDTTSSAS